MLWDAKNDFLSNGVKFRNLKSMNAPQYASFLSILNHTYVYCAT